MKRGVCYYGAAVVTVVNAAWCDVSLAAELSRTANLSPVSWEMNCNVVITTCESAVSAAENKKMLSKLKVVIGLVTQRAGNKPMSKFSIYHIISI